MMTSNTGRDANPHAVDAGQIRRFEPKADWFVRGPGGIHGIAHESRVVIWTQVLAAMAMEEGLNISPDVLGWAAAIHDTQRWDDGIDSGHGERAAEWIEGHSDLLPPSVPLHRVAYLCRWHVPPDEKAPEMTDELRVFKDADALDRWRIGGLDPSFLRTPSTHLLLEASRSLWTATRDLDDHSGVFREIIQAATNRGILNDSSKATGQ